MAERPTLREAILAKWGFTTSGDRDHKEDHEVLHKFYNTRSVGQVYANGANRTVSFAGVTPGTFVPIAIDTNIKNACNFVSPANGVLQYDNETVPFCLATYHAAFSVSSANNVTLKFSIAVNDVVQTDSTHSVRTGVGADFRNGAVVGLSGLTDGATFQLYVANMSSQASVEFIDFSMVVRV